MKRHTFYKKWSKPGALFFLLCLTIPVFAQEQEPLKYEVSVKAMAVPIFAVDTKGNPVYDLKEEEIQLYVNGKPFKILLFNRYGFEYEEEITEKVKPETVDKIAKPLQKIPERYLFLIIDSVFNSLSGLQRSKEIAANLVREASPGDTFIVLENNPGQGLKYVIGPEKDKKILTGKINQIKQLPVTRMRMKSRGKVADFLSAEKSFGGDYHYFDPNKAKKDREDEKLRYITDMKIFSKVLVELKFALKTITKPKIVFLISEGISRGAFKEEWALKVEESQDEMMKTRMRGDTGSTEFNTQQFYFQYLKNVAEAINDAGAVIYSINPRRMEVSDDYDVRGDDSLKFLAAESGGQYFRGMDTQKLVKRVRKSTAAYYEVFFYPETETTGKMHFQVKCKRKGVRVHSINYSEKERAYADMPKMQKKLFAFNLVTGGTWSRMVAKVDRLKYKKRGTVKKGDKTIKNIEVTIPRQMRGRAVDIFVLLVEPVSLKANIDLKNQTVDEKVKIGIQIEKDKKPFVVIIDLTDVHFLINPLILQINICF